MKKIFYSFSLLLISAIAIPVFAASSVPAYLQNPNYVAPQTYPPLLETPKTSGQINSVNDMYQAVTPQSNALINNYVNNSVAQSASKSTTCTGSTKTFRDIIQCVFIAGLIRPLVPLLIGLGVVVFIYGVLVLMFSEGGEKKEEGKQYMLWGIVGIFVMVSVWGLVNILKGTFGLNPAVPKIEIRLP